MPEQMTVESSTYFFNCIALDLVLEIYYAIHHGL